MLKNLNRKLKSNNGESLAEVMISVLIIAIGLALLSSLIMAASHMMDKGEETIQEMYAGSNSIEAETAAAVNGNQSSAANTDTLSIKTKEGATAASIPIEIYEDEASGLRAYYINRSTDPLGPIQP